MAVDFPSAPTNGQTVTVGTSTYTYNSSKGTWDLSTTVVVGPTGPTGTFSVAATTAPTSPSNGSTWLNSETGKTYIYYADGTSSQWVQVNSAGPIGATGPTGKYTTQATAPTSPLTGDAWMNTTDGRLYIYNGTSWFEPTNNQAGPTGPAGATGATGPAGAAASVGKIIAMAIVFGG